MAKRSYDNYAGETIAKVQYRNKKFVDETDEEYAIRLEYLTEKALEADARGRAWSGVYEKTARILTGDTKVSVSMEREGEHAPAAKSDGKSIVFNLDRIDLSTDSAKASTHGSFYHELCHLLYTPRENSVWGKWVMDNDMLAYANLLEDTRIETLYSAKYPSTQLFLLASTFEHVLEHFWQDDFDTKPVHPMVAKYLFALSVGRTYIPSDIRKMARDIYIKYGYSMDYSLITDEKADMIADIINEYRTLVFPRDYDRSYELMSEFKSLFGKVFSQDFGCATRELPSKGRPESQKKQEQASDKAKADQNKAVNKDDMASAPNKGEKPEDSGSLDSDHQPAPETIDKSKSNDIQKALETFKDFVESLDKDPAVVKEAKEFQNAVRKSDRASYSIRQASYTDMPPMEEYAKTARLFAEELEQLSSETEPMWELEQPSGKLNITRAMNADINDRDKLFDRWYEGNDSADIEAVLLLDISGSMGGISDRSSNALWAIKRGLEKIDASVTAYAFGSVSRLLYSREEKAKANKVRMTGVTGSTNPNKALEEAETIMRSTNKPNKLVFIITDGEWDEDKYSNASIARMQELGVIVSIVYISLPYPAWVQATQVSEKSKDPAMIAKVKRLRHGADVFKVISSPKEIVTVAREVVKAQIRGGHSA